MASPWAWHVVMRSTSALREHPAYAELQLPVSPAQLAAIKQLGDLALQDPLLITREGVIIDGYARKAYADSKSVLTLPCVVFDIGEAEALRMMLSKHRRSAGWNDYNRIRLASRLKAGVRERARANQQAGGRFKGSANLTEANVRKEISDDAGVSQAQVAKFNQLHNSDPEVLNALATGEIRIHRAWQWRELTPEQQREELRQYRLKKGLKQPVKTYVLRHQARRCNRISLTVAKLGELLQRAFSMQSSDRHEAEVIDIELIKAPGKTMFLSPELYEALWPEENENQNGENRSI
jgi:hypothetical protein